MPTVYHAIIGNPATAENTITAHKGTREWIAMFGGAEIIENSAEEVPEERIDGQGRYIPLAQGTPDA